ncbi:hypothetical protein PYR77_12070 [Acinetobacter soli]|uniref:cell division protein BlhA n=1 Tax=Acinetobacter soli TaxID=487316 RepID=UPI0012507FFE|nr:hypothetical protein [Acinetobacter soli]WEH91502.1 hypothetical protein PYR75_12515 [Acinetobacter soli]WEH97048.1 hypothetical protein PYR76_11580 [Acinetobacter soli]WEI00017.1 hypothetical protein PYR77_12070 [Acinetobacter soli]
MALNVGHDFKTRWLNAPEAVRQTFKDDLDRICDLLEPKTPIQYWIEHDQKQQQLAQQQIEEAYAALKAELIEQARIRKQQALEKSLAEKRAEQARYHAALYADEVQQFKQQTVVLAELQAQIDSEVEQLAARYHKNPDVSMDYSRASRISDSQIISELESVRLRLELEADTRIEEAVAQFRSQLKQSAQEEIDYILSRSNFSNHTRQQK